MSGYKLGNQLNSRKRPKRVAPAYSILMARPNDSPGLQDLRQAIIFQVSVPNWKDREFGAGFDRVHTWYPGSPFITSTDYNNDMEYNWEHQHSIPHPLFRRLLTGTEIPAIVPNPDPNPFMPRRISVDDIPPPCVPHPLPPFSTSLTQVTQMKPPMVMIPLSIQVLSELPGTGHRSTKGRIYRA